MSGEILDQDEIAAERRDLLRYVKALRKAIAELRPGEIRNSTMPTAMAQISMIVETTEQAANEIMGAADEIMALPQAPVEEYRAAVEEQCLRVIAACSFQDLAGQRINKVVELLLKLEVKIGALGQLLGDVEDEPEAPEPTGDGILLNGPAAPGEGVDQSEIDALFG